MSTHNIHANDEIGNIQKISLNICFLELFEEFPKNSKTSSNQPRQNKRVKETIVPDKEESYFCRKTVCGYSSEAPRWGFFVSKGNPFRFLFSSAIRSWCGGRKVSSYIIIVKVIFYFLWDYWAHPGFFENQIPLKSVLRGVAASQTTVLHMKRLNQTESPIFVILCVLCLQRQSFLTFILMRTTTYVFVEKQ